MPSVFIQYGFTREDDAYTGLSHALRIFKKRARQFMVGDGTSIQPVSAFILRLVQVSAGQVDQATWTSRGIPEAKGW